MANLTEAFFARRPKMNTPFCYAIQYTNIIHHTSTRNRAQLTIFGTIIFPTESKQQNDNIDKRILPTKIMEQNKKSTNITNKNKER